MNTKMKNIALFALVIVALALPLSAQNATDWNSCWCGGWATSPVNITCYEGTGHTGGCTSEIANWNNHASLFTLVAPASGVTMGAPSNGKNEVNSPISSSQASSLYGYSLDSTTYGVALMEPEANFGNFNSCEEIGSPNGQPSGQGCGTYTQADVLINANFQSAWTTSRTAYDGKAVVQTTVLHEVGHILGMHHVFQHFSTLNYMNDDSGWFVTRIDSRNIRSHYPAAAKSVTDAAVYPFKYGASQYGETYSTFTPTSVAAGGTVSLSNIRVENVGSAASLSNVAVTFYLSSDTNITSSDTVVGTLSWPTFSTWWESSSAITLTVPASVAGGTYYIGGIITSGGATDAVTINNSFLVRTRSGSSGTPRTLTVTGSCTAPGATTLSSPAAGATGVATSPTLSWTAVTGATSYDLYLSTGSTPTFLKNVTTTSTTAGPLTANTVYYWNVVAKNSCGSSAATATRSFTTANTSTVTPLTSGQTVSSLSGATASWKHYVISVPTGQTSLAINMSGGTGDADLYVRRGAQPTSSTYDYRPYLNGNTESVNVTNPVAGDWYISIYAYTAYSGVSLTATYTGGCTNPAATTLSSPTAGATGVATSPTLSWSAVSGATSYDVYLSTGSSPTFLKNVTTTSTSVGPLSGGTVYYWYVVAKNSCGSGPSSGTRSFTTASTTTCTSVSGTISTSGTSVYQPSSSGYVSSISGSHTGKLTGPSTADFDLYLQKWNGSSWASVASGTGSTSTENVTYSGTSGTYRWRVYAYSGTGSYTLCTTKP
jgi:hypothetical protein